MTGALEWIEGPVWTAEIEDTCRYPDDDDPGAFLVSIRSDEDGLRIDVEHSTRGNRLDSDWIEGADLTQAKARAETMMARFVERWRAYHAGFRQISRQTTRYSDSYRAARHYLLWF